jgi:hypothetical protein
MSSTNRSPNGFGCILFRVYPCGWGEEKGEFEWVEPNGMTLTGNWVWRPMIKFYTAFYTTFYTAFYTAAIFELDILYKYRIF